MDTLSRGMMISELKEMTKLHGNAQSLQMTNQRRILKQQQTLMHLKSELLSMRRTLVLEAAKHASAQYRAQLRSELELLKKELLSKRNNNNNMASNNIENKNENSENSENFEKKENENEKIDLSELYKKYWIYDSNKTDSTDSTDSTDNNNNNSNNGNDSIEIGPFKLKGKIIKGYQRGREIDCKTANLDLTNYINNDNNNNKLMNELSNCKEGVYFGWAKIIGKKKIYKNILSIGKNPHFNNNNITIENHLINKFKNDFYDSSLKIIICGYIRPQFAFKSLDDLKRAIAKDIEFGTKMLDEKPFCTFENDEFFFKKKNQNQKNDSPQSK